MRSTVVAEPESALRPPPSDRCQACRSESFRLAAFPLRTFHFLGVWSFLTSVFLLLPLSSSADGYVNVSNPTPLAPYTNWATAATVIQDAIDAAPTGGVVWVTNGVYATGGEPANLGTTLTNRARVNKSIALRSVNGPSATSIVGYGPGSTNGPGAVRCVWLGSGSSVEGFTLTNGHTLATGIAGSDRSGGGAWCTDGGCVVSNCVLVENRADENGAGVQSGTIVDCTFRENWAVRDGGAMSGATALRCTLVRNWANRGAGAAASTLADSTIASNQTNFTIYNPQHGGGLFQCTATACDIVGNQAAIAGGGSCSSVLHRCTLRGNGANTGAGAYGGAADNSVFHGNVAWVEGGGAFGGMMTNCTVAANRGPVAGGVMSVAAVNSIVWDNRLDDGVTVSNHVGGGFSYSCTHPLPAGTGNLNTDPLFAGAAGGDFRLASGSPCLEVGYTPAAVGSLDRAGGPRLNGPVDMGAYEGTEPLELAYLAVSADPVGAGTVTGAGTNYVGTWVSIGATPTSGWVFVDWHDGVTTNPRSVRVPSGGTSYVARFRAVISVPLTLTADPPEGGTVTGGGMYLEGSMVDIGAAALPGWYFDRWSDGVTNAARTVQVPVGGTSLTAQFLPGPVSLDVQADPVDAGTVTGAGMYFAGTWVSIGATSTSGWVFVDWNDGITTNPRSVMVPSGGTSYVARFRAAVMVPLTLTAEPPEGGTVTGGGSYMEGSMVGIQAAPSQGWRFTGWSDGSTAAVYTVKVPAGGATLKAYFSPLATPEHFVSPTGGHLAPFATWATAATNIQNAIDVSDAGDRIWVTNGVYASGGRVSGGTLVNRVAIDRAVVVRSVNGPSSTIIVGAPAAGGGLGLDAVRCAWVRSGAALEGFTLTNGYSQGYPGESRSGGGVACQDTGAIVSNCVIIGNHANIEAGGALSGTIVDCTVVGNRSGIYGGGLDSSTAIRCSIHSNFANQGGGAHRSRLDRCDIRWNTGVHGGGSLSSTAINSLYAANAIESVAGSATGGAAAVGMLTNCTLVFNRADIAGGLANSTGVNCIVWGNTVKGNPGTSNHVNVRLTHTCTLPLPPGTGNLAADPQFVGIREFHLLPGSPCLDAADPASSPAVDIEGDIRPQGAAPDIGCDETGPGTGTGAVTSALSASFGEVLSGMAVDFVSTATGPASQIEWVFDDGLRVTNRTAVRHGFGPVGPHEVLLLAVGSEGVSTARVSVTVTVPERYVSPTGDDAADGTSWATAKATIQGAVDACAWPGMTVWVTNGVYASGGRPVVGVMTNRVTIDRAIAVRSVNGPAVTHIVGAPAPTPGGTGTGAVRCVWVGTGATLQGFTLTNGYTQAAGDANHERSGGGAFFEWAGTGIASNCVIVGNCADNYGGGVQWGRVMDSVIRGNRASIGAGIWAYVAVNCLIAGNVASNSAGAVSGCALTNCTVTGNQAPSAAGVRDSQSVGCIVYGNMLTGSTNVSNYSGGSLTWCRTEPLPGGTGNSAGDPLLVGLQDHRLLPGSSCIDAGPVGIGPSGDIEGDLRPQGVAPDIGCDEWHSGVVSGQVTAALSVWPLNTTEPIPGVSVDLASFAEGPATRLEWVFHDGVRVTNRTLVSRTYAATGSHEVLLIALGPDNVSTAATTVSVGAAERFVSPGGSDAADGKSWATAKATIQAGIDACPWLGMTVWVTNGVYATGGRAVQGTLTNRVTIDKATAVRSVNGPAATVIVGNAAPGGGCGFGAVRCAWLGVGASLEGFTLTNGYTQASPVLPGSTVRAGGGAWCEGDGSVLSNCLIVGNQANVSAGGVQSGTLFDCVLSNNLASSQGGAGSGITAVRCRVRDNSAPTGAGIAYSAAINCLIAGNVASSQGGGAYSGTLTNCTIVGNRAASGGGTRDASVVNSILWGNTPISGTNVSNYAGGSLAWCCSVPLPAGTGNTADDPLLVGVGDFHILPGSSCIDTADPLAAPAVDIEGDVRPQGAAPDIGCDETGPGTGSGPITAAATVSPGEVGFGFAPEFVSYASGAAWQLEWVFDDGFRATNQPAIRHAFATAGLREVLLIATGAGGSSTGRTTVVVTDEKYFVSPSGNDEAPGTNWATAKATIQAAVDACILPGATVWVTNGVYATGGRAVVGTMTNRVTIDKPVKVQSVNGPEESLIVGSPAAGGDVGAGAVRCVWLGSGASLHGFTLTNGFTQSAGDEVAQRSGGGAWGQSTDAVLSNCVVRGNRAYTYGAGIYGGTAFDCRIESNRVNDYGGGAAYGVLLACTLSNNVSGSRGGATYSAVLEGCLVAGNQAAIGAGAHGGSLDRCVVRDNRSFGTSATGGGLASASARNSVLVRNTTTGDGGGAYASVMSNCTVIANTSAGRGGGVRSSTLINSIVYYNSAPASLTNENHDGGTFTFSCTTPTPPGTGNLTNTPGLAGFDVPYLLAGSSCIDGGFPLPAPGSLDVEGEARTNGPSLDIGADEFHVATHMGDIAVALSEAGRSQAAGITVELRLSTTGRVDALFWDFGDGTAATNEPAYRHEFAEPGCYVVRVRAVNADREAEATNTVSILDTVYVSPMGDDASPGTNWATAKATLQAGVDASMPSGAVVWVTNGVYEAGGRAVVGTMTNRLVLDRPVTVISVGGARSTVILGQPSPQGGGAGDGSIRCVWMTNGATLVGFTLSNGFTRVASNAPAETCGGAVWCATPSCVVSQCVIEGNAAHADGGGVLGGTLAECVVRFNTARRGGGIASNSSANCLVSRNVAAGEGGGAFASRLTHCSVLANQAATGGGMRGGGATNCIVYFNTTGGRDENYSAVSFVASCTHPLPWGPANLDADPGLGGSASPWLLPGSPCIDAGLTALSLGELDFDGEPRLQGTAVDMGCDEFSASVPAGAPLASIVAPWAELATDYGMDFQADTSGQVTYLGWDFGDGVVTSDVTGVMHAFAEPGTYEVRLVASNLAGMASSIVTVRVERAERFVAPAGNDLAPGTNWATAKATIQGGVDACTLPGTFVWVTNGVYDGGGRPGGSSMTNRVAIDRPVRVFSVEGPSATYIVGARSAGAADGCSTDSVRCVWMTNGAWIAGFTLTNGFSSADAVNTNERSGGGAWCANRSAVLSNCVIRNCGARFSGGGTFLGSLFACEVSGCVATNGGGAVDARLDGCMVFSNRADYGAGAYASDSGDSTFRWNIARVQGGGVRGGTHDGTELRENVATNGGGAYAGMLRGCVVVGNIAGSMGGGAHSCTQEGCLLTGNVAGAGGGAYHGLLYNCALVGNQAKTNGGGARSLLLANCTVIGNQAPSGSGTMTSTQRNSIVYFNVTTNGAALNYTSGVFEYSCATPMPDGAGNIADAPRLAGINNPRLLSGSTCIDAGTNAYAWGSADLYGKARVTGASVDIGCDEYSAAPYSGLVAALASADCDFCAAGQPGGFSAMTTGMVRMIVWDFGDGVLVTNETTTSHVFALPATYDVRLIAANEDGASTNVMQVAIGPSSLFVAPWGDDLWQGTNWATAKATIQAAVDASALAGTVLVTSGVYAAGGRVMEGTLGNRVAIPRRMIVRSVDGPESTFIVGSASPTNNGLGAEAVRCAWLTNGTVLAGFTLTNGFTRYVNQTWSPEELGGGAFGTSREAVISNCVFRGNGATRGAAVCNLTVVDSTIVSNRAVWYGGGAYYCNLFNSALASNWAGSYGGGASFCSLSNCVVASSWAAQGGGIYRSRVERSRIERNAANSNGGMDASTSSWCVVVENQATGSGGGAGNSSQSGDVVASNSARFAAGAYAGTLSNCFVHGNTAAEWGAGAYLSTMVGCTIIRNNRQGVHSCSLRNCIVYYNEPENHASSASGSHNCSWPPAGTSAVTNDPMLAGSLNPHLLPGSPCINAGTNAATLSVWDFDGEMRTNGAAVDIGCDEFWLEGCTGTVAASVSASWTHVAPGYPVVVDLDTEGRLAGLAFDTGGGVLLTNAHPRYSLAFPFPGVFPVTVTASNLNGTSTGHLDIIVTTQAWYVAPFGSDAAPGTNWATAKATLQAAADDYPVLGGTIWVTNGVYDTGGRVVGDLLTNRVALRQPVAMRSMNGADATFIAGMSGPANVAPGPGAVRCAWLASGATLSGFTLTNGFTETTGDASTNRSGGGAWCSPGAMIERCRIARCWAAESGGGVYSGNLRTSVLFGNFAQNDGGGAYLSILSGCSVASNRAGRYGGGVSGGVVTNGILYFNTAGIFYPNYTATATERSCAKESQTGITTTLDPGFRDLIAGDLTLSNGSPCINAGLAEPWMAGEVDLAGNPRVIGGTVDIGAYEFAGGATASGIPWQWLLDYDLATDGTADGEDVDGDGQTAYAEQRAGTHPWDPLSALGLGSAAAADLGDGVFPIFRWASVSGRVYRVGLSTNLLVGFDALVADDVPATPPENTVTDRTDAAASFKVYRVEVK